MRYILLCFVALCLLVLAGCAAPPVWISRSGDMSYYDAYDKAVDYCAPYGKKPRHLGSALLEKDGEYVTAEQFDCQ